MELAYIVSLLISAFCLNTGGFYCPVEVTADSMLFIIVAIMFLHKLKRKMWPLCTETWRGKIVEALIICLVTQVLLLTVWINLHLLCQLLGDEVCSFLRPYMSSGVVNKVQDYAGTVGVLVTLLMALLTAFNNDDIVHFYGRKEDLVSESVLAIVEEQRKVYERWQRMEAEMEDETSSDDEI